MARLSIEQKTHRVLIFLVGVVDRRIAAVLAHHGFTQEQLDEGWTLLRAAAGGKLNITSIRKPDPDTIDKLDQLENT